MFTSPQSAQEETPAPQAADADSPPPTPSAAQQMVPQVPPAPGHPGNFQAMRTPMTSTEHAILKQFLDRQRAVTLGAAVVGLAMAVLFYAYLASFVVFLISFAVVASTPRLAYRAIQTRKAVANGHVMEVRGTPAKLGGRGGFFTLHFGPQQFTVPLTIYDQFSPHGEGSLRYVEGANLLIAVNGRALLKPTRVRRPRGVFANATWPASGG